MPVNNLFNQPLMNKYLKRYKKELSLTHSKKEAVINWIKKLEKGELKQEVSNYGNFSRIILEKILGYDYDQNIEENVKEDYGRGLSEFTLKKDDKKFMVIELKGSDTDLDKPQNRQADKRTPLDQAFDYAKKSGDINWIMVSNYNEFRLYNWHKKQHKFISFKAEELKDPETFKLFQLVFSKFSTIDNDILDKLVSKTIFVQRDLEKEFYKLYSETRLMIVAELEHIHPEFTREQSVHYAQLILNRYIFICFAEDLNLLPGEISVESIENPVKNKNIGRTEIWHRINSLFLDLKEGNEYKKIYGYNGGLFSEDIEFLKIRDIIEDHTIFKDAYQKWNFEEYSSDVEKKLNPYTNQINPIYKNLMIISSFNFSSEVDVNILGHIFENSIGEIEELKADQKGRRKKEGVFYTPEYITDYICRNTIIPYLSKSGKADNIEKLISEYYGSEIEELDEKLKNIKIVDPACGSGAFLNKAGDILLEIHQAIHEEKYKDKKGTLAPYFDNIETRREILLNNIYGVDLNEESVEITKLSLFLKVCKKGLKLPNLDNNIKCGNSLIDDPEYTDKPFNWNEEFKEIFECKGFDIVIGNPPYVNAKKLTENMPEQRTYLTHSSTFKCLYQKWDLYIPFIEKGLQILKQNGLFSMIIPYPFINQNYAKLLREHIIKNFNLIELVDLSSEKIFSDATVKNCIPTISKEKNKNKIKISKIKNQNIHHILTKNNNELIQDNKTSIWDISTKKQITKEFSELKTFGDFCFISIGMVLNANEKIAKGEFKKADLISNVKTDVHKKQYIEGKDLGRYNIKRIRFLEWDTDRCPSKIRRPTFIELHENKKIIINKIGAIKATLDNNNLYSEQTIRIAVLWKNLEGIENKSINKSVKRYSNVNREQLEKNSQNITLEYVLAIINSNMGDYFINKIRGNGNIDINPEYLKKIPIPESNFEEQQPIVDKVNLILQLNKDLNNEINCFKEWLTHTFYLEMFSNKLDEYFKLSFNEFLVEMKNKKVDIRPRKTQELFKSEFDSSLSKINPLLHEIEETDAEIDQMVYELYGLTNEEIKIIEESLKV